MPKCCDCGFLAVRDIYDNQVCEATPRARQFGVQQTSQGMVTRAPVFCYANVRQFELAKDGPGVLALIQPEIECAHFRPWHQGKSAKEHEEMSFMERMEARTLQWRAEEVQLAEQRRAEEQERAAQWREEELQLAERRRAEEAQWREEDLRWRADVEAGQAAEVARQNAEARRQFRLNLCVSIAGMILGAIATLIAAAFSLLPWLLDR